VVLKNEGLLQDDKGRWNQFTGKYSWDESCICCDDEAYGGTGEKKDGAPFGAAPNIDHSNDRVRKVCIIGFILP
jgi:alpha-amylase